MATEYTIRSTCRVCHSPGLDTVLDYGLMPLAGGFVESSDPRSDMRFPLTLKRCGKCTHMQTAQDIDPGKVFSNYSYSSSVSSDLVNHFQTLSEQLGFIHLTYPQKSLYIDVGCNDGVLIKPMREHGVINALGIDPSDVALRASKDQGWRLVNRYLTPDVADEVSSIYGKASIITACNVLAHTSDPHEIVEGIRRLIKSDGIVVIEVHYQASMISLTQFDTVYHEHTCYYSLRSLIELLRMHDLKVWRASMIPNHGGSIRIFASPNGKQIESVNYIDAMIESESDISWRSFGPRSQDIRKELTYEIDKCVSRYDNVMAYGASGRGTILLNFCDLMQKNIYAVIDKSPLRAGKVVPGVKIPIFSPSDIAWTDKSKALLKMPDVFLLTAWNYADSIHNQHPEYHGKWLVPLPEVKYI